ncbi:MAG: DUF6873 family GME fold protein [Bacteroidales bacterium]
MKTKAKLIFADHRLPDEAKNKLAKLGNLILFNAGNKTHPSIKGHPDIFLCQCGKKWIIAPNTPKEYVHALEKANISFEIGKEQVDVKHPGAARYNVVCYKNKLYHNLKFTDKSILEKFDKKDCHHIPQAYSRCSTIALDNQTFITSDKGVEKALKESGKEVLYVDPYPICLPGLPWGFFGGCCGIDKDTIYFSGSLRYFKEEKEIRAICKKKNYNIIELFNGSPFDGGSIFFMEEN